MSAQRRTVPRSMRALVMTSYADQGDTDPAGGLEVREHPVPRAGRGEVLIRVSAAPVNPTDLALLLGRRPHERPLPRVPGAEGSGIVVASGGGALAAALRGRRVAFGVPGSGDGAWAQYAAVPARNCLPLPKAVDDERGSMSLVNPVTAYGLLEVAHRHGTKAVVNTAAAGALGRMIARLGARRRVQVIDVVRRAEQVEALRRDGREHVLDSSDPEFDRQLGELCRRLGARIAFDAIGGATTGRLLDALPAGGHLVIYGGLSLEPASFDLTGPIYENKSISFFYLPTWLATKNAVTATLIISRRVAPLLTTDLGSEVGSRTTLDDAPAAIADYARNMTSGKVLLLPNEPPGSATGSGSTAGG
ncbi:MAG TPA: zinc-binding dehydrogenase [Actinomycetota bacterium]|nr:zinc-binding dehydrogenase [Actinomycetota bacterium]